jgi:nucleotide-binding universal stress UspA family protein
MTDETHRIIVGVDGSEGSLTALRWAVDQAYRTGADVDAVLAYDSGLSWIDVGSDAEAAMVGHAADQAKRVLHRALEEADLPPEADVRIHPLAVEGEASDVLVELAREAKLLVTGTRGRGGFVGLLLGSVSERCAERSRCPIVIVPTPRDETTRGGS